MRENVRFCQVVGATFPSRARNVRKHCWKQRYWKPVKTCYRTRGTDFIHHQQYKEISMGNTTTSNRQHVQAWRAKNRRLDYAPIKEAREIIDRLR
jgi:dethiobiotin synthetase